VLAIIDQRECSIALLEALANLAYAQNSAAALYFKAAITTTTGYGDLSAAKSTARKASVEVETAEHTLRADQTVLEQAQADVPLAEAVAAADQQVLLQAQDKLAKAITNLRAAETAPEQASLATSEAHAADSLVLQRKAELEQAQLNLDYTIVRSPVTGVVGRTRLEIGQIQRCLAMCTNLTSGVSADKVDSQYLVGSVSSDGHSINNHCSGCGSARQ
jgi:membrane fusion protein (multidrug efflux system)